MKRLGIVILALAVFTVWSLSFVKASLANEDRIYMGLNIPGDDQPCRNEDTEDVYGDDRGVLPELGINTVGAGGFDVFLDWVNATYGGEDHQDFGYTVSNTRGYYQGEPEDSRIMLLFFSHETAVAIGTKFQRAFCQDSVYVNTTAIGASERIPPLGD